MAGREREADVLHLEEIELWARIGVPDAERAQAQRLTVSLTLWPLAGFDSCQDEIGGFVDYSAVVEEVRRIAADRTDKLIETMAEAIAAGLLAAFPIARVRVELRKFILPDVKHVAAILTRERRLS